MSHVFSRPSDDSLLELALALDIIGNKTSELYDAFAHVPLTILNLKRLATELSLSSTAIHRELNEAMMAVRLLVDHRPLAATFPDGTLPPPTLSPRQVVYLVGLASK